MNDHTNGRTVLVAGATGMLGSAVAAALHRTGATVTSLSRSPARAESLRGIADTIVLGDATRPDTLRGAFDGVDAVISCLGAPMAFTTGDRRSFRDLDTVANLNLIRAARAAGVRRFVYVSLLVRPAWARHRCTPAPTRRWSTSSLVRACPTGSSGRPACSRSSSRSSRWPAGASPGSPATGRREPTPCTRTRSPRPA